MTGNPDGWWFPCSMRPLYFISNIVSRPLPDERPTAGESKRPTTEENGHRCQFIPNTAMMPT